MVYIASVGVANPEYSMKQGEVKDFIKETFMEKRTSLRHLLTVFDHAKISERQFTAPLSWYKEPHTFSERNELYHASTLKYSLQAIDQCLKNEEMLQSEIPYDAIDMIVFVSSTGISTPSMDAFILNERSFKSSVVRVPLWGLGCAGGAIGLSRANDWIQLYKDKTALVVCCELCSLTFLKDDVSTSNIVGTALFGDGVASTLLIGEESPYKKYTKDNRLKIHSTSSRTEKQTIDMMGWKLTEQGLQVIFSKQIPQLVDKIWKPHVIQFLHENGLSIEDITTFIAHPGGRKVLEEMEKSFHLQRKLFHHAYDVLDHHGNMSSATVLYVLQKWMLATKENADIKEKEIICALGPGFSSELLLVGQVSE